MRFSFVRVLVPQNALLEFVQVLEAKEQVVAGTIHLTLEAIEAGRKKVYEVKVWVKPWLDFKELQEFCHAGTPPPSRKVHEHVPDLAQSIAGLILSSDDQEFQDECITLLGLGLDEDVSEVAVESCISKKMTRIIEMNDTKENAEESAPYLFECEKLDDDSQLEEEDGDEDMVFYF